MVTPPIKQPGQTYWSGIDSALAFNILELQEKISIDLKHYTGYAQPESWGRVNHQTHKNTLVFVERIMRCGLQLGHPEAHQLRLCCRCSTWLAVVSTTLRRLSPMTQRPAQPLPATCPATSIWRMTLFWAENEPFISIYGWFTYSIWYLPIENGDFPYSYRWKCDRKPWKNLFFVIHPWHFL